MIGQRTSKEWEAKGMMLKEGLDVILALPLTEGMALFKPNCGCHMYNSICLLWGLNEVMHMNV